MLAELDCKAEHEAETIGRAAIPTKRPGTGRSIKRHHFVSGGYDRRPLEDKLADPLIPKTDLPDWMKSLLNES